MPRAKSPVYVVPFRRRREGKTNYEKRFSMLKSRKTRLVVRKRNRDLAVQLVQYSPIGDRTIYTASKKEFEKLQWIPKANMPTAYLYGMLAAKAAKSKNISEAILDIGLHTPTKNSIVFAVAKGAIDAGLKVNFGMELDEKRIRGEHIASYAKSLKEKNADAYKKAFAVYLKSSKDPEQIPKMFEEAKAKIIKG